MNTPEQRELRLERLLEHWGHGAPPDASPVDAVIRALDEHVDRVRAWEILATLTARIPTSEEVISFARGVRLNGARVAIDMVPDGRVTTIFGAVDSVELVRDAVLVDVHDTSRTDRTTGIQRVVRETVRRWMDRETVIPVAWSSDHRSLRLLTPEELDGLHGAGFSGGSSLGTVAHTLVVPLGGRLIITELAAEFWRAPLHRSLAEHSSVDVSAIGYDLVPVTSSETSQAGIVADFPKYLDALAHTSRIATISHAAASEYEGWRQMLAGSGRSGPEIRAISLAAAPVAPVRSGSPVPALGEAADGPMVLVVGSHEPRKNHLAVLHAARRLWAADLRFRLCFAGGNAWGNEEFTRLVADLQQSGRPLVVLNAVSDQTLSTAYATAAFTVFPSLNEGFGLPIAESIVAGTPVITSNFGSMREIAEDLGGCVLVDPRDDDEIRSAMLALLTDPNALDELRVAAQHSRPKSWDRYAAETFDYLTGGG